jgi:hypothetical protein
MAYRSALPRSVYILGDGLLFDDIIAHMLTSVSNLRVIQRVYTDDNLILTDVNEYHPDVILLTETNRFSVEQILVLLLKMPRVTDLRIIVMSVMHNNVQILDRSAVRNNTWADIPHAIQEIDDWNDLFDLVAGRQL